MQYRIIWHTLPADWHSAQNKTSKASFKRICRLCLPGLLCWQLSLADDTDKAYQLGKGYPLADSGISLGGYASTHMEALGPAASLNLSSLSLFVSWDNGSKLRFFSETEAENTLTLGNRQTLASSERNEANLHIERLYMDYLATDNLTVRVGKILTPVGQWNLIHVDPLVWTTSRPVATTNLFADYATGVMLQGVISGGEEQYLEYSLYGDYSSSLVLSQETAPNFDNAQGLRLRYHLNDNLQLGLSYVDFALQNSTAIRNHLAGFDLAWSYQRFAINSEIVYRNNNFSSRSTPELEPINGGIPLPTTETPYFLFNRQNMWQGYLQGICPLTSTLYAVGRYEYFDQAILPTGQAEILGLTYRPKPPLAIKLEYRQGSHNGNLAPSGLFASFSVLF